MSTPTPDDPHMFWTLYGPPDESYDEVAVKQLRQGACVRSGACCLAAPCPVAQARGEKFRQRCSYLVGDTPGEYACQLALDGDKELIETVGIGSFGCPDPRTMSRLTAGQRQTELRRSKK